MIRELRPGEAHFAYLAMRELRPHLTSEIEFSDRVNVQQAEGYRLIGSFIEGQEHAVAVAGFRLEHYLAWGHILYCDDLSSRPEFRRQGHAGALVDWMIEEARRLGCDQFHLDSGVQRHDAHRLYLNKGMRITSHHFALDLRSETATNRSEEG